MIFLNCHAQTPQDIESQRAVSFYMSSENKGWAIEGTFQAEYRIYKDFIEINLQKAKLKIPNTIKEKKILVAMTAGLGYNSDQGQWSVKSESLTYQFDKTLDQQEVFEPSNIKFLLPINQSIDVPKTWIVIKMVIKEANPSSTEGYVYVHSGRDIFNLNRIRK